MSMQVNGNGYDYALHLYQTRLQQQTRPVQDAPVEAVQPVQRRITAMDTTPVSRSSSALTADRVSLSLRAQQMLAQGSSTTATYGTALASADSLASAVPQRGQILREEVELPGSVSAASAVRKTSARNGGNLYRTTANAAVSADHSTTFESKLKDTQQKADTISKKVLSAGMQRYVQMQNNVLPQVQTTAVAMNLLA